MIISRTIKRPSYLDGMEITAIIFQEGIITNKIGGKGQLNELGVQTLSNTSTNKSKAAVLQDLTSSGLQLSKKLIGIFNIDSGGNLFHQITRCTLTSARNPLNELIFFTDASISPRAFPTYLATPPG